MSRVGRVRKTARVRRYLLFGLALLVVAAGSGVAGFYVGREPVSQCRYELREVLRAFGDMQRYADDDAVYGITLLGSPEGGCLD